MPAGLAGALHRDVTAETGRGGGCRGAAELSSPGRRPCIHLGKGWGCIHSHPGLRASRLRAALPSRGASPRLPLTRIPPQGLLLPWPHASALLPGTFFPQLIVWLCLPLFKGEPFWGELPWFLSLKEHLCLYSKSHLKKKKELLLLINYPAFSEVLLCARHFSKHFIGKFIPFST